METFGVYFGSRSLKTFLLSVKHENICIGTLLNIRRIDIFAHGTCYPETMQSTELNFSSVDCFVFVFKRQASRCMFQNDFYLKEEKSFFYNFVSFSDVT